MEDLTHLLYRGESECLDFKREQYRFAGASDGDKSELLKDILAMANAWRTETAYILIGVDECGGPPPTVCGISDHLDDAALQQFVNSKTNRPIIFNYSTTSLSGQTVGVLRIPVQKRPFNLKTQFAGLRPQTVYLRRGSSTDVASPDEIAAMGEATKTVLPELHFEFADFENRLLLGPTLRLQCTTLTVNGELPDLGPVSMFEVRVGYIPKTDYFREVADFLYNENLCQPIAMTLVNKGSIMAKDVRVEISLEDSEKQWELHDDHFSATHTFPSHNSMDLEPMLKGEPVCEVRRAGERWLIAFNVGTLQPQRTLWPAFQIFGGCHKSGVYELHVQIFAENLPAPIELKATVEVEASQATVEADEIVKRARRR